MTRAGLSVATDHAGRLRHRGGLPAFGLVGARCTRGARTGLACGAARGNPAPTRGPAGCLLDGLPPGRRPRQGRSASSASLRDRLRRPLTRPSSRRPGETRSHGAGEDQRPTSRQEVATVPAQEWTRTRGTTNARPPRPRPTCTSSGGGWPSTTATSRSCSTTSRRRLREGGAPMRGCGCLLAALFLLLVIAGSLLTAATS
jgi:hypothetical protein